MSDDKQQQSDDAQFVAELNDLARDQTSVTVDQRTLTIRWYYCGVVQIVSESRVGRTLLETLQAARAAMARKQAGHCDPTPYWAALSDDNRVTLEQRPITELQQGWRYSPVFDNPLDAIEWLRSELTARLDKCSPDYPEPLRLAFRRVGELHGDWVRALEQMGRRERGW